MVLYVYLRLRKFSFKTYLIRPIIPMTMKRILKRGRFFLLIILNVYDSYRFSFRRIDVLSYLINERVLCVCLMFVSFQLFLFTFLIST